METPSVAAKLSDTTSRNHVVDEARNTSTDATAIATGCDADLEKKDDSSGKVDGRSSAGRVRTIRNGKVRRENILYSKASKRVKTNDFYQWLLLLLSIYSTSILYGLDTTIVASVQAPVIEAFGQDQKLGWIGIGFPLGSVAVILAV